MVPSDDNPIDPLDENQQPENNNGLLAFDTLSRYLNEDEWFPRKMENKHAFSMGFTGTNGDMRCYAVIHVDMEEFLFYAVAPVKIPADLLPSIAEFLTRANYGLRIGNFEMDYSDGEVRYKSSVNFEDQPLTDELIAGAIYPAVHTLDRYLPGLLRVAFGGATPLEAIEEIEGGPAQSKIE